MVNGNFTRANPLSIVIYGSAVMKMKIIITIKIVLIQSYNIGCSTTISRVSGATRIFSRGVFA